MIDLFEKHRPIAQRFQRMMEMGVNAVGVTNEQVISPTRACNDSLRRMCEPP